MQKRINENFFYGIAFNHFLDPDHKIFAVVGGPFFTIYECSENGELKMIQAYEDPDVSQIYFDIVFPILADILLI